MENNLKKTRHEELALMAQMGNQEAEEFLIREYKDVVRGKAHSYFIMGGDREDVVQEAMIGLFKAIKSYAPGNDATFKTYADVCINRQILDAIKAANRKKHSPLNTSVSLNKPVKVESDHTLEETIPGKSDNDPETLMVVQDIINYISQNESNKFSEMEIQVWNLYMEGKSHKEIALCLDKNPKAVYNAMERTKKKIMAFLNDVK